MSTRRALISPALSARFRELCDERQARVAPETFGEMSPFVSRVREQLLNASPAAIKNLTPGMSTPSADWLVSESDCLASLRALSTGETVQLQTGERPPLNSFIERYNAGRKEPAHRFQLLMERYACPLNFSHSAEDEARELILARLMASDRTRIEKTSLAASESSDLWLRLNLVALHAARMPDLRFLDALNYYYELLPVGWQPQTQPRWLFISYIALYARALAAWI